MVLSAARKAVSCLIHMKKERRNPFRRKRGKDFPFLPKSCVAHQQDLAITLIIEPEEKIFPPPTARTAGFSADCGSTAAGFPNEPTHNSV